MDRTQLIETAQAIVADGKGILAADESTPTIGKRFASMVLKAQKINGLNIGGYYLQRREWKNLSVVSLCLMRHLGSQP
jgi:fructose-bisphosphate aldolase class 1